MGHLTPPHHHTLDEYRLRLNQPTVWPSTSIDNGKETSPKLIIRYKNNIVSNNERLSKKIFNSLPCDLKSPL